MPRAPSVVPDGGEDLNSVVPNGNVTKQQEALKRVLDHWCTWFGLLLGSTPLIIVFLQQFGYYEDELSANSSLPALLVYASLAAGVVYLYDRGELGLGVERKEENCTCGKLRSQAMNVVLLLWEALTTLPLMALLCSLSLNVLPDMFHHVLMPALFPTTAQNPHVKRRQLIWHTAQIAICGYALLPLKHILQTCAAFMAETVVGVVSCFRSKDDTLTDHPMFRYLLRRHMKHVHDSTREETANAKDKNWSPHCSAVCAYNSLLMLLPYLIYAMVLGILAYYKDSEEDTYQRQLVERIAKAVVAYACLVRGAEVMLFAVADVNGWTKKTLEDYARLVVRFNRYIHFTITVVAAFQLSGQHTQDDTLMNYYSRFRTFMAHMLEVSIYLRFLSLLEFQILLWFNQYAESMIIDEKNESGGLERLVDVSTWASIFRDTPMVIDYNARVNAHFAGLFALLLWLAFPPPSTESSIYGYDPLPIQYLLFIWKLSVVSACPGSTPLGRFFFPNGSDSSRTAGRTAHQLLTTCFLSLPFLCVGHTKAVAVLHLRPFLFTCDRVSLTRTYVSEVFLRVLRQKEGPVPTGPLTDRSLCEVVSGFFTLLYQYATPPFKPSRFLTSLSASSPTPPRPGQENRPRRVPEDGAAPDSETGARPTGEAAVSSTRPTDDPPQRVDETTLFLRNLHANIMYIFLIPLMISSVMMFLLILYAVYQTLLTRKNGIFPSGTAYSAPTHVFTDFYSCTLAKHLSESGVATEDGYKVCSMSWHGLGVNDFLVACAASYSNMTAPSGNPMEILNTIMGDGEDWVLANKNCTDARSNNDAFEETAEERLVSYIDLYSKSRGISIVAIRGSTASAVDWLENGAMFGQGILFDILSGLVPGLHFYPPTFFTHFNEFYSAIVVSVAGSSNADFTYYKSVVDYVERRKKSLPEGTKMMITGHSLGGAVAKIVGCLTKTQVVAFSAPGLADSYRKFTHETSVNTTGNAMVTATARITLASVRRYVTNVYASDDPVAMIGRQGGSVNELRCEPTVDDASSLTAECHSWMNTAVLLWRSCPTDRGGLSLVEKMKNVTCPSA